MPSFEHEFIVGLCRRRLRMALDFLAKEFGVPTPQGTVTLDSGDFGDVETHERRCDTAVVVRGNDGSPLLGVVVESQLDYKPEKFRRWAVYAATLADRYDCPVEVLVFCPDQKVADRYDVPFHLGSSFVLRPLVVGPDRVPLVSDPRQVADNPELAVFSAGAHGRTGGVLDALLDGLALVDPERALSYTEITLALLGQVEREYMEAKMAVGTYRYQSEFTERLEAKGRAEGEARSLIRVLERRGIALDDGTRARIESCTDLAQLDAWLDRAATAESVHDVLG